MSLQQLALALSDIESRLLEAHELALIEEQEINEGVFQDFIQRAAEKGSKAKAQTLGFLKKLKTQLIGTKDGALLLKKMVSGQRLSSQEARFLRTQIVDLAKGIPLLGLFVLPGGGVATLALIKVAKKYNFDLMPSAFAEVQEGYGQSYRDWRDSQYDFPGMNEPFADPTDHGQALNAIKMAAKANRGQTNNKGRNILVTLRSPRDLEGFLKALKASDRVLFMSGSGNRRSAVIHGFNYSVEIDRDRNRVNFSR